MPDDATQLLARVTDGDRAAVDHLLPAVYDELRARAGALMASERPDHTLSATALVHEAYLKLIDQRAARWQDRAHFCAVAAQAMRRILVDHARTRKRVKRGAGRRVSLDTELFIAFEQTTDLLALDDAMNTLAAVNEQASRVVELRYFGGLTIEQTAIVLGVSDSTVEREWRYARAWLYRVLGEAGDSRRVKDGP
ncbi:MAG: sigma-70 family RNA polymerase sigma factor [Pseudomonadales bacterium]